MIRSQGIDRCGDDEQEDDDDESIILTFSSCPFLLSISYITAGYVYKIHTILGAYSVIKGVNDEENEQSDEKRERRYDPKNKY